MILSDLFSAFIGLCCGIITGAAIMAFYTVLGIFSNVQHVTGYKKAGNMLVGCTFLGVILGILVTLYDLYIPVPWFAAVFALFGGAFIGVFILSLAETINVLPHLYKIKKSHAIVMGLIIVFAVGKLVGSLIDLTMK